MKRKFVRSRRAARAKVAPACDQTASGTRAPQSGSRTARAHRAPRTAHRRVNGICPYSHVAVGSFELIQKVSKLPPLSSFALYMTIYHVMHNQT